jgi:hypothetical protein
MAACGCQVGIRARETWPKSMVETSRPDASSICKLPEDLLASISSNISHPRLAALEISITCG